MDVNDVIHGDRFAAMCDFGILDNMEPQAIPKDKDIKLVFCKQDRVDRFFPYIAEYGRDIILVTHNADTNIGYEHITNLPGNVVHWFAQNVLVSNRRVTPIPIGLERPGVGKSSDYEAVFQARERRKAREPEKRFLLSLNPNTNSTLRVPLLEQLGGMNDVTIVNNLSFKEYLDEIVNHEFVISPPGNGYDCHRTWEALYVGAVPIVWSRQFGLDDHLFYRVPALILDVVSDAVQALIAFIKSGIHMGGSLTANVFHLYFCHWEDHILRAVRSM